MQERWYDKKVKRCIETVLLIMLPRLPARANRKLGV